MGPTIMFKAIEFRDSYNKLLQAWRADVAPSLKDAMIICASTCKAERSFLEEFNRDFNSCSMLSSYMDELKDAINIPEMFDYRGPVWATIDDTIYYSAPRDKETGEDELARLQLEKVVRLGCDWHEWKCIDLSSIRFHIKGIIKELNRWIEAVPDESMSANISIAQNMVSAVSETPGADTDASEDKPRDIPRAQSIALLYAVFVRLGITQTYTDTAIARLIEAVTGGKIRDGKNSYAWRHRNDKLQPDVEALLDEFMKGGQSSE